MGKYRLRNSKPGTGAKDLRVLFLTLDMYRQAGGIQQMNKLLGLALDNIVQQVKGEKSSLNMYSLHDSQKQYQGSKYTGSIVYNAFSGHKPRFIRSCICIIPKTEILILSHINLLPVAALLSLIKPRLRVILLAHGSEVQSRLSFWKITFLRKKAEIWAVSAFTAQYLKSRIAHLKRINVLSNALPPDFVLPYTFAKPKQLLLKHHLSQEHKVLLTVCRINRHTQDKGIEQVLRSIPYLLSVFSKFSYLIVGETEAGEEQRLKDIAATLGIDSYVAFLHFVPPAELTKYYLLADVFVMPSKKEGFGLSFIEAAACGCRVVAGNTDGSTDALLNGRLGILIDPDNPDELKKAIASQLYEPRSQAQAKITQDLCLSQFSTQAYQRRLHNLLFAPAAISPI